MSINVEEARRVEEFGLAWTDNDGNVLFYITTGVGSPVGTPAPVPTLYVDENANIWRKFGNLDTDWNILIAGQRQFSIKKADDNVIIPNNQQLIVKRSICLTSAGSYTLQGNAELIIEP